MIHGKVEMIAHEHDTDSQLKKKLQHKLEVKWKTKITIYQMEIIDRVFLPEQRLIELAKWDRKTVKTALRLE